MNSDSLKHTLLIVDDVPDNIDTLNEILCQEYEIKAAVNGKKALEIATEEPQPDLILLDIMMPEIDGYEVTRRLKANKHTRDIPIIFVTSMGEVDNETMGLELGAVDYITKPISPPIVKARIRNHLLLKMQRDQLKKSISVMEHKAEILQQKAEIGIQAAGLAHDMNNILAALMLIELIPRLIPDDLPVKNKIEDYAQKIKNSIMLGREICQGYTSYIRDIGHEAIAQPLPPLLQPLNMYAQSFKGELIRKIADDVPFVKCKGYQLKRVFINLFVNAIQVLENKKTSRVIIRLWSKDDRVMFSITDNGPGIRKDIISRIFDERFSTKPDGTGLGLFLVKQIVDGHNGTIEVHSEVGKGTTFTISLPASDKSM